MVVVRVSANKGDYANYVADAGAKAGSKMKEVVEPKEFGLGAITELIVKTPNTKWFRRQA